MNTYEPSIPRAALGLTAAAMAAITIGAFVILPAKFDSAGGEAYALAAAKTAPKAPETPDEGAAAAARVDAADSIDREGVPKLARLSGHKPSAAGIAN